MHTLARQSFRKGKIAIPQTGFNLVTYVHWRRMLVILPEAMTAGFEWDYKTDW